ncbi:MAG: Trm112 family protein [Candidatus Aenigmarchaeota archaeon]|nr:Trm112 family protein [Candidatus Aenigmarchaeota archaeon]
MPVAKDLLNILACPRCKGKVREKGMFIVCNACKLAYPVLDEDVPDMLIEDAWPLEKAKKDKFKHELKL